MADSAADTDVVEALRGVTGQFATSITIVVSLGGNAPDEPHAATLTAFAPVSQRPLLVAVFFATDLFCRRAVPWLEPWGERRSLFCAILGCGSRFRRALRTMPAYRLPLRWFTANRRKMRQASSELTQANTPEDAARLSNLLQICSRPGRPIA